MSTWAHVGEQSTVGIDVDHRGEFRFWDDAGEVATFRVGKEFRDLLKKAIEISEHNEAREQAYAAKALEQRKRDYPWEFQS